jgi:WD40 repeat protein
LIASIGADRTLRFWQPTIGRLVRFARLPSEPLAVEWTADGSHAAATFADGHLRLIDPNTVEVVHDLPVLAGWAYTLARSPRDGSFFVGGENGRMQRVTRP